MVVSDTVVQKLIFEAVVKGQKDFTRMNNRMNEVRKGIGKMSKEMRKATTPMIKQALEVEQLRKNYDSFGGAMGMSQEKFKKFNEQGGVFQTRMGRMANKIRMATHGLRGFRMELLGVMFFGMGVMNFFTGLLRPSADLFGIFELWSILLSVTFLPVMEDLFGVFMKFFEWVLTWDEDTKKLVGSFVLFGVAIGSALFMIGMLGLGIGSVIQAFGFLGIAVTGGTLGLWAVALLGVVAVLALIYVKQDDIRLGILNIKQAWINGIRGTVEALKYFIDFMASNPILDPFGTWGIASGIADTTINKLGDMIYDAHKEWQDLTNGVNEENNKQMNSISEVTDQVNQSNANMSKSNAQLIADMKDGNGQAVTSTFSAYTEMYAAQTGTYEEMINATKRYVTETNNELAKIGKRGRGGTSVPNTSSSALQTSPSAVQSLINYVNKKGSSEDKITLNNSINVNATDSDSIVRAVKKGIDEGVEKISLFAPIPLY